MKNIFTLFLSIVIVSFACGQNTTKERQKTLAKKDTVQKSKTLVAKQEKTSTIKDTVNNKKTVVADKEIISDTLSIEKGKLKPFKKDVHASYYADKFNGRKTTSGRRFDNNKYTAAHKKLPFGTKVKVTNVASGKSVIVEVIDRGPFVKSREIDLSKRAFMEITKNKSAGVMMVNIEILE